MNNYTNNYTVKFIALWSPSLRSSASTYVSSPAVLLSVYLPFYEERLEVLRILALRQFNL